MEKDAVAWCQLVSSINIVCSRAICQSAAEPAFPFFAVQIDRLVRPGARIRPIQVGFLRKRCVSNSRDSRVTVPRQRSLKQPAVRNWHGKSNIESIASIGESTHGGLMGRAKEHFTAKPSLKFINQTCAGLLPVIDQDSSTHHSMEVLIRFPTCHHPLSRITTYDSS